MSTIDAAALGMVDGYRNHLSARKGWRCASGVAGHGTCSTVIRKSVAERGALASIGPAIAQFAACGRSARGLRAQNTRVEGVFCCGPIPIPFRF